PELRLKATLLARQELLEGVGMPNATHEIEMPPSRHLGGDDTAAIGTNHPCRVSAVIKRGKHAVGLVPRRVSGWFGHLSPHGPAAKSVGVSGTTGQCGSLLLVTLAPSRQHHKKCDPSCLVG